MSPYVLIAEFDPQQTAIYRHSVERRAVEAVFVRDGAAATHVLQARGAPILLICDLSLPQADGFSVIAELRRMSPPERSAILVFSAHNVPIGGAMVFAERARNQVEALCFDGVGAVTLSAGIVEVQPEEDARTAIQRADAQLYEAKRLGRNRVRMAAV